MDVQSDTARKLAQLNGMLQIAAATRTPLPPIKVHASGCTAFGALATGLKPLSTVTHQLHMFAISHQLEQGSQ